MQEKRSSLTMARLPFAGTWLACSAILVSGLAATIIVLQLAVVGRLMISWPRLVTEGTSAVVQGLAITLLLRRRWKTDHSVRPPAS